MRLKIILPVHNRRATTEKLVRHLLAQNFRNWDLFVVDDGSTDGTGAMVKALVPTAEILRGSGDLWWAGALQMGIHCALERC